MNYEETAILNYRKK